MLMISIALRERAAFAAADAGSAFGNTVASAPTANENDEELSISEMAEAFDVTMRTLRFYEEKGLLHPRRLGNRRYYNGFCRSRLTLVLKGKAMGMGLDDIAALVAAVESNENDAVRADQVRMLCDTQLGELKARRAALDEQISETERALSGLVSL